MAELVNIVFNGPGVETQTYNQKDDALITNNNIYAKFGDDNDRIEYFIYDLNNTLVDRQYESQDYVPSAAIDPTTGLYSSLSIDPKKDLESRGFNRGTLNIQYNFLRNLFNSAYGKFYWIKEISQTRKEIKLASQQLSNTDIRNGYTQYQAYIAGLNYYNDFYLNFGSNNHIIAVNVAYTEDADGAYLLIKLYEPLPSDYGIKDQLWIVEKVAESVSYTVDVQVEAVRAADFNALRGANFNVNANQKVGQTTPYYNQTTLLSTSVSSSFQKMLSYYQDRAVQINVDYSDFSNFIHFSSATARVENFVSKLTNIESYNMQIASQSATLGGLSSSVVASTVTLLQKAIEDITTNFDTYEYYLYYSSGSTAWPKSNSIQPYRLYSVTSSQARAWLGSETTVPTPSSLSILYSASLYDATNKDLLANVVPQYIQDDTTNQPYITFVNMVGQHFDNIWLYYKDVTNRFNATNNPNTGISMDLVADALINLGCTLYTNSNVSDNLYYSIFGINANGSLLPPTGSEQIKSYVTSSIATLPAKTLQNEIYKRIYHNIPYLYKTKGTRESLNALVNIFGIPRQYLTINEFGGYNRASVDGIDAIYNVKVTGSSTVTEISSSVLHPYTTLQYYNNNTRLNSRNLEFGYSPADSLNSTITSSLGFFQIDELIGDPSAQYSASYASLDSYKNNFFAGYNYYHNIYEYIRLLKYFDNSVFKMAKDFVPARASLSTGLIVKSHILERNKYERHEPEMDASMNYSESIDLVSISATDAPELPYSTQYVGSSAFTVYPGETPTSSNNIYGPVTVDYKYSWEKYTGEFGGSVIDVTTGDFSQLERSSITSPWTSSVATTQSMYTFYNEGALVNNFMDAQPSKEFISAEYSYGINTPINFANIVSQSSCDSCYRMDCINYTLDNSNTSIAYYSYTDCYNNYFYSSSIAPTASAIVCIKPGTLFTSSAITATAIGNCGTTRSSTQYGQCYNVLVTNNDTAHSLDITWTDCNGLQTSGTMAPGPSYAQQCARRGTMALPTFLPYPPTYSITELNECGVFSSSPACFIYTGSWSPTGGGETGSYRDCYTGATVTQVFPDGGPTLFRTPCAQSGSFRVYGNTGGTVALTALVSRSCAYAGGVVPDPQSSFCTRLISASLAAGNYMINYAKCNGEYVTLSSSSVGGTLTINDCVRANTIYTSNVTAVSLGSTCGFYPTSVEYTGSRDYADIQDYNYYRRSSVNSRYAGAKYNNAENNSNTEWIYGATYPARDYYVDYTGLFTSIESSSYFPNQLVAKLPYLADISGGIQELNLRNENWVYFQNIYKAGSTVSIKQFNSTQYSNQKYLDKTFKVVESGYSYQPYYYRDSGSDHECFDTDIAESYSTSGSSYVKLIFAPGYAKVYNGSGSTGYAVGSNLMYKYFPLTSFSGSDYPTGTTPPASGFWDISLWTSGSYGVSGTSPLLTKYTSGSTEPSWTAGFPGYGFSRFKGGYYYTAPFNGFYRFSGVVVFQKEDPYGTEHGTFTLDLINAGSGSFMAGGFVNGTVLATDSVTIPSGWDGSFNTEYEVNVETTSYIESGSRIAFRLKTNYLQSSYDVANDPSGSKGIYIAPFANFRFGAVTMDATLCRDTDTEVNKVFNSASLTSNTVSLLQTTDRFFTSASTFNPIYTDYYYPTSSALYGQFGDINYTMEPEVGDYMLLYYTGGTVNPALTGVGDLYASKLRITKIDINPTTNTKRFTVYPNFPSYITAGNINTYAKLVFTKRVPDETTMILEGRKNPGKTSYGFMIPENINPTILKNANTLQSTIQSQILNY